MLMIGSKAFVGQGGRLDQMSNTTDIVPEVAIVLSDEFAPQLADLVQSCHVWVVRSPYSERIAREIWQESPSGETQPTATGITVFTSAGDSEENFLSVLDTVELHHGIASEGASVNIIRVLGVQPTDAIRRALASLGFGGIETIPGGFVARWSA